MAKFDDDVDVSNLIAFAKAYQGLGWAIQEQLDDMLDDSFGDLNPNAVSEIKSKLGGMHPDIDSAIAGAESDA